MTEVRRDSVYPDPFRSSLGVVLPECQSLPCLGPSDTQAGPAGSVGVSRTENTSDLRRDIFRMYAVP